jgi:DNA replication protein DnaC
MIPDFSESMSAATCAAHGEYQQKTYLWPDGRTFHQSACPKCSVERRAAKEAEQVAFREKQEKYNRDERRATRLRNSTIPERFQRKEFADFKDFGDKRLAALRDTCVAYAQNFDRGASLVMCGNTGTGKTHLACCIAKYAVQHRDKGAVYARAAQIIREVKDTYGREGAGREVDVMLRYSSPDMLIIDEVGVQFGTDAEKVILFDIINARYEKEKSTVLISNLTETKIKEFVGERVIDRIREGGKLLVFTGESMRVKVGSA